MSMVTSLDVFFKNLDMSLGYVMFLVVACTQVEVMSRVICVSSNEMNQAYLVLTIDNLTLKWLV